MGTIKPYEQDKLASPLVGTPGVNKAAGLAERQLAAGAGQLRDQMAQADQQAVMGQAQGAEQSMQIMSHLAGQAISGIGQLAQHYRETKQATQKAEAHQADLLNEAQTAYKGYQFSEQLGAAYGPAQQQFNNEPEKFPDAWKEQANNLQQNYLDNFDGTPLQRQRLTNKLEEAKVPFLQKGNNWSWEAQKDQVGARIDNAFDHANTVIGNATGSLNDILQTYSGQTSNALKFLDSQKRVLGDEQHTKLSSELASKTGNSLLSALTHNLPDDSEARFAHIAAVRHLVEDGTTVQGMPKLDLGLTHQMRDAWTSHLDKLEANADRGLQADLLYTQAKTGADIQGKIQALSSRPFDTASAQAAMTIDAKNLMAGLDAEKTKAETNPFMPPQMKARVVDSVATRMGMVTTLTNKAEQIIKDEAARTEAAHREVAHEEKAAATAQAQEQRAEFRAAKGDTRQELGRMEEDLRRTAGSNIGANIQQVQQQAYACTERLRKAASDGHITPDEYNNKVRDSLGTLKSSVDWQKQELPVIGGLLAQIGITPQATKVPESKAQKAQVSIEQDFWKHIGSMNTSAGQAQVNNTYGLSGAQLDTYHTAENQIKQRAASEGWKPEQLNQRLNEARNWSMQNVQGDKPGAPTAAMPTQHAAVLTSTAPKGYNGNIDVTKRQLVLHPGGRLDAGNSTDAARKQFGGRTDGDYGTEFSMRITDGDKEVSIPSIYDGKLHSTEEAVAHYHKTGEYLGKWPIGTPAKVMNDYEDTVHSRQQLLNGKPYKGPARHENTAPVVAPKNMKGMTVPPPPKIPLAQDMTDDSLAEMLRARGWTVSK